jgi:hypothetical protein
VVAGNDHERYSLLADPAQLLQPQCQCPVGGRRPVEEVTGVQHYIWPNIQYPVDHMGEGIVYVLLPRIHPGIVYRVVCLVA